jgi:hypothetical protein
MLRGLGIRAHEKLAVVGHLGTSAPDLLARDDVLLADPFSAGSERREV